jgi:hypothetical protein
MPMGRKKQCLVVVPPVVSPKSNRIDAAKTSGPSPQSKTAAASPAVVRHFQEIVLAPRIEGVYLLSFLRHSGIKKPRTYFEYYVGESVDVWSRFHTHEYEKGNFRGLILVHTKGEDQIFRRSLEKKYIAAAHYLPLVLLNGFRSVYNATHQWVAGSLLAEMDVLDAATEQLREAHAALAVAS